MLNCSSLFSSFECYWNQIISTLNDIEYQINYQNGIENWELIQSPILNQNILYQIFNSSIYQDISGNVDYSIQIKSCNTTTTACGNPSNQINLTTRIDSVKNLNFESYSNSIQLNWNYPNVPIINSIPKLNHYIISYQI
ncbi:tyrosine-protein phosphatase 69d [Anaeramoeba ignava]|uniref:Tyrosine-protein phosphatase 69d n=1 Tax=Anaeramoeba ignava TaxID=1746090 RepID=A0A9Q0LPS0_ANAIG|nr:tyrosine-protein phosphatase 69d [Anaeramoeba ignava]